MLKKILMMLVIAAAVFAALAAIQPADFRVERSITINAPVSAVFTHVNDLRKWEAWSPWAKQDPNMKVTYEGSAAGAGAIHTWSGNSDVGEGQITITESKADESIKMKLEMVKPMVASNDVDFTFKPQDGKTLVTWSMVGTKNFMAKAFGLIMNCDQMLGGEFEKGLAQLKAIAEGPQMPPI